MRAYLLFLVITHTKRRADKPRSMRLTTLPAGRRWNLCSIPRRGIIFFSSHKRPGRLWGSNCLFNVYRGFFTLWAKRPKRKATQSPSGADVKNITLLSVMLQWRYVGKHTNSFTFTLRLKQHIKMSNGFSNLLQSTGSWGSSSSSDSHKITRVL
jgi:hypothetical protein